MQLHVKGKNLEVGEAVRQYGERKLRRLERILDDGAEIELELTEERNPSIAASHVAEAVVRSRRDVVRARESSHDMKASIDQLVDKLERQVTRYREKRRSRRPPADGAVPADAVPLEGEPRIVKSKQFAVKPMSAEEAVLQLELVGHDFFVFQNADSGDVNVVYRRRDGAYGLIEPHN